MKDNAIITKLVGTPYDAFKLLYRNGRYEGLIDYVPGGAIIGSSRHTTVNLTHHANPYAAYHAFVTHLAGCNDYC